MRKSNTEKIGTVIQHFLREEGLETPYNQFKLVKALEEVLGHGISRYIGQTYFRNQTLNVEIRSAVLKQELGMRHTKLTRQLNEIVGAQVIQDIRFY